MNEILCAYCRGVAVKQPDGTIEPEVRHGQIRYAHRCDCACHTDQITTTMSVDMRVEIVIDVQEALLRYAEEHQLVQDDLDDWDAVLEDNFLTWLSEDSEIEADVMGAGVVHYGSEVDEVDIASDDININGLLRLVQPKLPKVYGEIVLRPDQLGMDPLFGEDDLT